MLDKLKALMDVQKKMQQMKQELDGTIFEIASSDGLVKIKMNGSQEVQDISIQSNPQEIDKATLEKAMKDAYNRAIKRSQELAAQKMKDVTGLNLPGLI
jgi:DNA-binding YbaB/EbfC family protein